MAHMTLAQQLAALRQQQVPAWDHRAIRRKMDAIRQLERRVVFGKRRREPYREPPF